MSAQPESTYQGEILAASLPPTLGNKLEEATRQHNLTPFAFGCAVMGAMLHRYTGETDVVFGTQIGGRDEVDIENLIGVFLNNLVIRFDASGGPTFTEFLARANGTVQEALIHQRMPFHKLVEVLNPPRDPGRTPLISINFTVLRDLMDHKDYGGFYLNALSSLSTGALYDFNFYMVHWLAEDSVFPAPRQLQSSNSNKRFEAALTARDLREETRLANRPSGFGFRVLERFHEDLSDEIFKRRFSKAWLLTNPYRVKAIRDAYLLAFFDTYVRNMPSPLVAQSPSPFRGIDVLKANEYWLKEAANSAMQSSPGSNGSRLTAFLSMI